MATAGRVVAKSDATTCSSGSITRAPAADRKAAAASRPSGNAALTEGASAGLAFTEDDMPGEYAASKEWMARTAATLPEFGNRLRKKDSEAQQGKAGGLPLHPR